MKALSLLAFALFCIIGTIDLIGAYDWSLWTILGSLALYCLFLFSLMIVDS